MKIVDNTATLLRRKTNGILLAKHMSVGVALLMLSACDRAAPPVELKNVPFKQVAKAVSDRFKIRDGKWESSGKITGYSMATLPDDDRMTRDIIQIMREKMASQPEAKLEICRDSKSQNMFVLPGVEADACIADHFRMEGDKVEIKAHCDKPVTSRPTSIKMTVTYAEDKMVIDSAMEIESAPGARAKPRKAEVKAHQVMTWKGKCDATTKKISQPS